MDEIPFYKRSSFYIISRLVFMLGLYGYAIYNQWKAGGIQSSELILDLILFFLFFLLWLAFFAQFILPVKTFEERRKIFGRLIAYLTGLRGPAVFIKNGQLVERMGESKRNGPGVVWLDSASGAVTHVSVAFKNTLGPGVHFTDWNEKIAESVDLHIQVQRIGPLETDRPFEPKGNTPDDIYAEMQKRRTRVSALTRDGIEVVPDIRVVFKIDGDPVRGDQPGSHFGYDEEAVRRAVINQAVDPSAQPNTTDSKVAWNELPTAIAADLWREYMSKFTLPQLFVAEIVPPASIPRGRLPAPNPDASALLSPVAAQRQGWLAEALTGMLHVLAFWLGKIADRLDKGAANPSMGAPRSWGEVKQSGPGKKTALQIINFMITERLTNRFVPHLDANGERLPGWQESREYLALKERGIRVLRLEVSNLRFEPKVEQQLVSNWTSNWLINARAERERIETARSFANLSGQENALTEYAAEISKDLLEKKKEAAALKDVVRVLLVRSRLFLIRSDRIHRRASTELQELEEVMKWLESEPT